MNPGENPWQEIDLLAALVTRCGNIRKKRVLCVRSNCPHTFCARCCEKMKEEYGPTIFQGGCPVCKECCCCTNKSVFCNRKVHCYRKCPASKHRAELDPRITNLLTAISTSNESSTATAEQQEVKKTKIEEFTEVSERTEEEPSMSSSSKLAKVPASPLASFMKHPLSITNLKQPVCEDVGVDGYTFNKSNTMGIIKDIKVNGFDPTTLLHHHNNSNTNIITNNSTTKTNIYEVGSKPALNSSIASNNSTTTSGVYNNHKHVSAIFSSSIQVDSNYNVLPNANNVVVGINSTMNGTIDPTTINTNSGNTSYDSSNIKTNYINSKNNTHSINNSNNSNNTMLYNEYYLKAQERLNAIMSGVNYKQDSNEIIKDTSNVTLLSTMAAKNLLASTLTSSNNKNKSVTNRKRSHSIVSSTNSKLLTSPNTLSIPTIPPKHTSPMKLTADSSHSKSNNGSNNINNNNNKDQYFSDKNDNAINLLALVSSYSNALDVSNSKINNNGNNNNSNMKDISSVDNSTNKISNESIISNVSNTKI